LTDGAAIDRLLAIVKRDGGGRVYAGERSNWGQKYTIGFDPVYAWLADQDVDQVGFTFRTINSLSTDIEANFNEYNPAQYQMLGIRYLLLPNDRTPPVSATFIASAGRSRLYRVATSGYFQVVDRIAAITADRTDLEQASSSWRGSDYATRNLYPGVAFAGGAAPLPTISGSVAPVGAPGAVVSTADDPSGGSFAAKVQLRRRAVVLLKASYDPSWTVTVDGTSEAPVMMAPSLVGVEVGQGRHVVRFRYAPYGAYPELLALGLLVALALAAVPRSSVLRRRLGFDRASLRA
jgi:hypothetical protein